MTKSRVSIILPTYNRADCIARSIESVLAQSHTGWELIVVDDGSTDGTPQLLSSRFGNDPRIRILRQENGGVCRARNSGLALATGDYIALLDSDDTWKPWKLEVQLACLQHLPELGMVWTDMEAVDPAGNILDPLHLRNMYSAYQQFSLDALFPESYPLSEVAPCLPGSNAHLWVGDIYPNMIAGSLVHTSTVLLTRARFERVQAFNESLTGSGEDYDFHLRTCRWGPVGLIDVPAIQYQKGRTDHLSHNSAATAQNFLRTLQLALQNGDAQRFPPALVRRSLALAHGWVAGEQFALEHYSATRHHALQSLRSQPLQPRLTAMLLASILPRPATRILLELYRSLRHSQPR